jgi:hypothetical protein
VRFGQQKQADLRHVHACGDVNETVFDLGIEAIAPCNLPFDWGKQFAKTWDDS